MGIKSLSVKKEFARANLYFITVAGNGLGSNADAVRMASEPSRP